MKEKSQVEDIDRSLYDFRNEEKAENIYKVEEGLTPEIVEQISKEKMTRHGCSCSVSSPFRFTIP